MWCNSVGFVCRLAPLLILRRVGKFSFFCLSADVGTVARQGLPITVGLGVVGGFENRPPGTEAQLKNRS